MINNHGASLAFNLLYNNSKFGKNMLNIIKHAFKSPAHPILLLIFHIIEVKLELVNNYFYVENHKCIIKNCGQVLNSNVVKLMS